MKSKQPVEKPAGKEPNAPAARPDEKSPSERHPGRKPEEAQGEFEDLAVRDSGNHR